VKAAHEKFGGKEMKENKNDWYQRNFWWILIIAMLVLSVIIIIAAILVTPFLLIGLLCTIFGFYVSLEVRKITQKKRK